QLNDDIKYMREQGAPLEYVHALRGWRYAEGRDFAVVEDQLLSDDEVLNLRMAIETFNKINNNDKAFGALPDLFRKIYRAAVKWTQPDTYQKNIYFDPLPHYEGGKHLRFFLQAIEEKRTVTFQYLAYHAEQPKTVRFDPYFLRHYDRRWYVGGFSPDEGFVRTFPLERIVGQPVPQVFLHERRAQYDAGTYWQDIYGITVPPNGQIEEVLLEFIPLQGKYFLSTPFFEPFAVIENTPEKLVVRLKIIPNIDLVRKIASLGADVRVLAPASLADELRRFFAASLRQYDPKPIA
ncbi:MAG: WYL domain-containing protein, partial [Saprospiraceae bacterium]|nr:WYL domain-containing protein [Saprospiraceae bacterium]